MRNSHQTGLAPLIAPVVLANITRRYPYHDAHLYKEGDSAFDPFSAHPAFGNSFDWHSSVHSHWTALSLLAHFERLGPRDAAPEEAALLHRAVGQTLTALHLEREAAHFASEPSYERPYGWAWAMRLAAEADSLDLDVAHEVRAPLRRFAEQLAANTVKWLSVLPAPIRHGVHSNTAFALSLMLDAARGLSFEELEMAILAFARRWFAAERDYPAAWERGGHDFLSGGLAEADLMRRVLHDDEFPAWWAAFLPPATTDTVIYEVAEVPTVADGQIVHLHGLNLSRAAMLARIASATGSQPLLERAQTLYLAGVAHAAGDDYLSTHWLPTFAWDAACSLDAAL